MQRTVRIASHALALVLISCLAGIAETSSAHLAKGSDKLRNGDISGAESELRQAVLTGTNDPQVYNLLGFICDRTNRSGEAFSQYKKALSLRPDFLPARNNLGAYYVRQGRPELALTQFQSSLKIDPADVTALYNIGIIRAQEGRLTDALESVRRAYKYAPNDMLILVVLAKLQAQMHDEEGVIESAEKILDVLRNHATSADSRQVVAETTQALAMVPDKGPNEQKRTFLLAEFQFLARDYSGSIASLNELRDDHRDIEYYNLLGMSQAGLGNFREARLALSKAISMDPHRADLLFNMGSVYQRARDNETAIKLFKRAIAAGDASPDTEFALALGYYNFGGYEDAIKTCLHIVKEHPGFDQGFLLLGRSYASISKTTEATAAIRKSLTINPECEQCYFHLSLVYLDAGKDAEAIMLLRKVLSMNPSNASAHFQLGKTLAKQKDNEGAVRELQRTIDLDPQQDLAYYQLGHIFLAMGDRPKGEGYLATARNLKEQRRAASEDQMNKVATSQR